MWPIKNFKKMPNQRHVSEFGELDGGGGISGIFFLQGVNQTENFIKVKTGNDIYYRGEKH